MHSIIDKFEQLAALANPFSYNEFSRIALYDDTYGYYRSNRQRVGRGSDADFFTASSLGSLLGKLVVSAATRLLCHEDLQAYTLVEIGNEPAQDPFAGVELPFKAKLSFPLGQIATIPDKSIVFSNELLDAQPFHRFLFTQQHWREIGVHYVNGTLEEVLLPEPTPAVARLMEILPKQMPEGYHLDISLAAENLLEQVVRQEWSGLLLFLDYGKDWEELVSACPQGTARAYHRQRQSTALLKHPGEQDLTTHVCWDRLKAFMQHHHFRMLEVLRQESFFMRYSPKVIQAVIEAAPNQFDPQRQALMQLLHPAHMGHAFQVLYGIRL